MNPAGVPYGRLSDMVLAKEFQIKPWPCTCLMSLLPGCLSSFSVRRDFRPGLSSTSRRSG